MLVTVAAVAVKFAVVALAATVMEAGTARAVQSSARATEAPPAGAAFDSVTVQVEAAFAVIDVGVHCRDDTVAGAGTTVTEAVADVPLSEAVTVTD